MKPGTLDIYINKSVTVLTVDNKVYIGILVGFDQLTNIVLRNCIEREYNKELCKFDDINKEVIVLRGDCIGLVGESRGDNNIVMGEAYYDSIGQNFKKQKISHDK
ncbi:hypothetical protein FG379_003281 [Cryptosporidium bovis]|uniref:uncharacterized protein n=1 Tax=Cryptosporidium bovis TaxID=310047 RepID=UPI003519F850|nr:hypothetical protein FG379_003281 [Cryptosporidium bovis]